MKLGIKEPSCKCCQNKGIAEQDSEKELKGTEKIHGGGEWNTSKSASPRLEFSRKVEGNESDTILVLQAVNASKMQIFF